MGCLPEVVGLIETAGEVQPSALWGEDIESSCAKIPSTKNRSHYSSISESFALFKAKVALAALEGSETRAQLAKV
jgi:hypothetical protein